MLACPSEPSDALTSNGHVEVRDVCRAMPSKAMPDYRRMRPVPFVLSYGRGVCDDLGSGEVPDV